MRNLFLCALALVFTVACGDTVVTTHDVEDERLIITGKLMALMGPTDDLLNTAREGARILGLDTTRVIVDAREIAADIPDPECEIYNEAADWQQVEFFECFGTHPR